MMAWWDKDKIEELQAQLPPMENEPNQKEVDGGFAEQLRAAARARREEQQRQQENQR
jgi:hypothetical protein